MKVSTCGIEGLLVIEPDVFADARGCFFELYNDARYHEFGIHPPFVQDNTSVSHQGVLRGLHFQNPVPQAKLVSVLHGSVFDVAVDLRRNSPTFGEWHGVQLTSESRHQFFVPAGFAHGFQVVSPTAVFHYKCSDYYAPHGEVTLRWDDPDLGIPWPIGRPEVSLKDGAGLLLRDIAADRLF